MWSNCAEIAHGEVRFLQGNGWTRAPSPAPSIAGCFRFLIFTQCLDRPARYGRFRRFDTNPSNPISTKQVRTDLTTKFKVERCVV